jgi:type I restriction enzyme, S subunit
MSWQTVKLGDTCEVKRGTTITEKQAQVGDVPVVAGGLTYSYTHNTSNREGNVITVSGSGANAGYVNFWKQPIFASDCSTIQSLSESIDIRFVFYFLKSRQQFINSTLRSGAAQPHVYAKDIAKMKMPLPPLAQQQHIVAILDKADEIKAKREQAIAKLEELAQRTFDEIFGDVRLNPKGWEKVTLEKIATKITDGEHLTPRRTSEGIKLLSARNVQDGYLSFDDVDYVDKEEYERISKRCKPEYGDILISCSGSIGRVSQIKIREPLALVRSAALVKPDITIVNPTYLEYYLRSNYMKAEMLSKAKSSSQANLFQAPIRALTVSLPPLHLQNEFEKFINKQRLQKSKLQTCYKVLTDLKVSLQHQAFTTGFDA